MNYIWISATKCTVTLGKFKKKSLLALAIQSRVLSENKTLEILFLGISPKASRIPAIHALLLLYG